MEITVRLGKRNAIYIPKTVTEKLNLKEGDKMILVVEGDKIELIPLRKPSRYWTEVDPDEVEEVGEEITRALGIDS
ncbi:AbrB/MazE/SpoVT family DNA-binding domain-containing protein [Stygiolobus azoricus]|uniref:AbrB/MazE/SpoVT family DNA-binding domain-containing protein n=1 Tax=Stygiolobus azoricus TaxID=41675 RepID=A0A650CPL4_9CREN|nr:AbrB/MazE/SpoVT family DNA-binding domain-containing protein [Stygiolobus azoricus]QGR19728.1 AbrB/MazE/SpoVT family DNA-binding domain-containing protein [Stygiolobus azoricus]